jgi:large subunit ribosomal protein L22
MEVKAIVKNTGIPPRKARLYINMVRGRGVEEALTVLKFAPSPIARVVAKVVKSAVASAENTFQLDPSDLKVMRIYADSAPTQKRFRARSRGRASPILKRSSHITVVVADRED